MGRGLNEKKAPPSAVYLFAILISLFCYTNVFAAIKPHVAVIDFSAKGVSPIEASIACDIFRNELISVEKFEVLDRKNMNKILEEQSFQTTGCTSSECAVTIGKILNMQYMIYGEYMKIGTQLYLAVEMINVESSKIESSSRTKVESMDRTEEAVQFLVAEMTGIKPKKRTSSYVSSGFGVLSITSDPPNANVSLDEKYLGKTKLFTEVKKGEYNVNISKDGYIPKNFTERIDDGATHEINLILQKGIGIEEASRKKEYFKKWKQKDILILLGTGILSAGTYGAGKAYHTKGISQYDSYLAETDTKKILSLAKGYQSSYSKANFCYITAISVASVMIGAGIKFIIDSNRYKFYNKTYKDLSSPTITSSIMLHSLSFNLTCRF